MDTGRIREGFLTEFPTMILIVSKKINVSYDLYICFLAPNEISLILQAMTRIKNDMCQCLRVQFVPYIPLVHAGQDNIFISKTLNDG